MRHLFLAMFLLWGGPLQAADLKPFKSGSFAQILAENQNKPLLLHFWSISCPTCVAHLPAWKEVLAANPKLQVVFVSTDPIGQASAIKNRLKKNGLDNQANYAFADSFVAKLQFEVAKDWRGELPFNVLVDQNGEKESLTGHLDTKVLAQWLDMQ